MFFKQPPVPQDWSAALRHLRKDPVMKSLIKRVGPCILVQRKDPFIALIQSIYAQQISTKIATLLFNRFAANFPRKKPTPALVAAAMSGGWDDEKIRSCGLSRQKRGYVLDLAKHFVDQRIDVKKILISEDEDVIEALTDVHGIGRWTAEMFLIFVMNRPNVLPVDDLGLQEGVRKFYDLPERPKPAALRMFGEKWSPYRSIATWYIWRAGSMEPAKTKGLKSES